MLYTNYEKTLIDLLGYFLYEEKGKLWIRNEVGIKVGEIKEVVEGSEHYSNMKIKTDNFIYDSNRKLEEEKALTYEFLVWGRDSKFVSTCLTLGNPAKLGFLGSFGVRSLNMSDTSLDLTYSSSTRTKAICEQVIVKCDSTSDLKSYYGKSYNYQLVVSPKNSEQKSFLVSDDNKHAFLNFEADSDNPFQVFLRAKYPRSNKKEEIHFKKPTTIRDAIIKDKAGLEAFSEFRSYANEILPFKSDIIAILLSCQTVKNDVLSVFYQDILSSQLVFNKPLIIELAPNCLFLLEMDMDFDSPRAKVYGTVLHNLTTSYPLGYVESDNRGSFVLDANPYIFKLNTKGEVERVYDFVNGIEIVDKNCQESLYQEYKSSKILKK